MKQPSFSAPFHFQKWIDENRHLLKPPVSNRMLFDDKSGLIVQVIGGGNRRVDFHDDPAQEFFYQIKGDMILKVIDGGHIVDIPIREGEVFLLPPHVRHSPQRPDPNSIGLVVEGARLPNEKDGFEWVCLSCENHLHRVEVVISDIVRDLPPLFAAFAADMEHRRCQNCGTLHPGAEPPADWGYFK